MIELKQVMEKIGKDAESTGIPSVGFQKFKTAIFNYLNLSESLKAEDLAQAKVCYTLAGVAVVQTRVEQIDYKISKFKNTLITVGIVGELDTVDLIPFLSKTGLFDVVQNELPKAETNAALISEMEKLKSEHEAEKELLVKYLQRIQSGEKFKFS